VRGADNLSTFTCRLSWNLGSSTSWNPQGMTRPVMGLHYLHFYCTESQPVHRSQHSNELDDSRIESRHRKIIFSSPKCPECLLFNWCKPGISLVIKRPGRQANHSPPSSAKVKLSWSCTFTPSPLLCSLVLFIE